MSPLAPRGLKEMPLTFKVVSCMQCSVGLKPGHVQHKRLIGRLLLQKANTLIDQPLSHSIIKPNWLLNNFIISHQHPIPNMSRME